MQLTAIGRKALFVTSVGLLLAGLAAALFPGPGRAGHRKYTVAYLTYVNMRTGALEAGRKLGVRVIVHRTAGLSPTGVASLYRSTIAHHVDAIVSDGYDPAMEPIYRKVRKAGILLISSGDDIAGKRALWVSPVGRLVYAEALGDALASQIGGKGEYAVLDEQGEYPIALGWKKKVEDYLAKAYPNMKLVGALTESGAGDAAEIASVKSFVAAHPNLKGLISVTPTESYAAAEAITELGRIGQVFSAGNGGSSLDFQSRGYVRSGAAELVFASDPSKLGYLTVWATHYLLTGHQFRHGDYHVGGPIGSAWYYTKHRELRLDQPLTITKKNVAAYANQS
jgi:rhamnose transport system substrate-binding protein